MKLLTKKDILGTLPPIEAQDTIADPIAYVKFFTPDAGWTWYAVGGVPWGESDFIFYGYVIGIEPE